MRRFVLAAVLLCIAMAAFALPSTFLDSSSTDGFLGAGVMAAYDVAHGRWSLVAELFYGTTSRFGVGLTWMMGLPDFRFGSFSLDALYWYDPDSTGYGAIVVPLKLRLAIDAGAGNDLAFGAGLAAGLQDYALSLYSTGDLFLTLKALAEVDFWSTGRIDPVVMAGGSFEGTLGTPSGTGYVIYYY